MKKIYLSLLVAASASSAMAQMAEKPYSFKDVQLNHTAISSDHLIGGASEAKALGVTVWSDNFDDPSAWTIDNSGQTGGEFGWTIDATSDGWWDNNGITSTSGGNFAELSNGNPQSGTQALGVTYTLTTANPIDVMTLAGTDQVNLSFEEYGARFNDLQEVQVSTDGTTFTTVRNNLDYSVLSASGGEAYQNPETISINLAPYIQGNASSVWIRFSWTTNFPASAGNANVWIAYGWYIDDIQLITNPDNDLEAVAPVWGTSGLPYYQIPTSQVAPIDFSTRAFNNGIATQNNATLNVDINSGTFTGTSAAGVSIPAGASDSLALTTQFTPPGTVTSYTVDWNVSQDEIDDVPTNNVIDPVSFEVTEFIYARDAGAVDGGTFNQGNGFEAGNLFDVFAATNIYSIDVQVGATAVAGAQMFAKIYSIDPNSGDFINIDQSDYYTIQSTDINSVVTLNLLSCQSGLALNAGETYLITVGSDGDGGASNDVVVATSGASEPQTSFYWDATDQTWYYTTSTPMVRMNLDATTCTVGLNEIDQVSGVSLYPNPAVESITVDYALTNAADVTIEVVDIAGKTMSTIAQNSQSAGVHTAAVNTSDFASGIYYVNITSNNTTVTEKFIKK